MNRNNLIPITKQEADNLQSEGVATLFNCLDKSGAECHALGFFEASANARRDIVLVLTYEGSYIRAREDLVKSEDEVFVGFIEDGKPPEFDDVFVVRKL